MANLLPVGDLPAGSYRVSIEGAGTYLVVLPQALTLGAGQTEGQLIVKLHRPRPTLGPAHYHVGDTVE